MQTLASRIHNALKERRFNNLSIHDWGAVIMSLITEDIMSECAYNKKKVPKWTEGIDPVYALSALNLNTRDADNMIAFAIFVGDHLPTKARIAFCEGLTEFVREAYESLKLAGYKNDQSAKLIDEGLTFSSLLDGAVRADILEEMALDHKLHCRHLALGNLLNRDFRNAVPKDFWVKLEDEAPQNPYVAYVIMRQYVYEANPHQALRLLKRFPAPDPNLSNHISFPRILIQVLEGIAVGAHWEEYIRRVMKELPAWVPKYIKASAESDPIFKKVSEAMEPAST